MSKLQVLKQVKFDQNGLIAAIIQDAISKEVLTLAYMNEEALQKTLETNDTWLWSRSRQELWNKGATSGNRQQVVSIYYDCDGDALVVKVIPSGPACHKGSYSCFSNLLDGHSLKEEGLFDRFAILNELEQIIASREAIRPEGAYTTYLFEKGVDKILKKVGEEAAEVIIAAKNRDKEELRYETADLFYHVLVLLREQKVPLDDIMQELSKRR
ncbi:bifunctional phosphoribosyl-AMP cyclohydrolase/phosphoribosyl-ATP diphosphatase HisIE [Brevibacillus daliensis]|uniref:bifunctional phosphoribosyl-AMP cyclohydrolase/phosphoribosyl-ATP diphosphatase HisIE n=1 Tax=Brevibacillus daliensis TaxID=2892995 RepID=UPI001E5CC410|nr:bifunctional phosphoribosyl-AMP cyclohydrolase/phosphoribosyl-ATP diphosphatase HisIE [Brevibacillus daliensis]